MVLISNVHLSLGLQTRTTHMEALQWQDHLAPTAESVAPFSGSRAWESIENKDQGLTGDRLSKGWAQCRYLQSHQLFPCRWLSWFQTNPCMSSSNHWDTSLWHDKFKPETPANWDPANLSESNQLRKLWVQSMWHDIRTVSWYPAKMSTKGIMDCPFAREQIYIEQVLTATHKAN